MREYTAPPGWLEAFGHLPGAGILIQEQSESERTRIRQDFEASAAAKARREEHEIRCAARAEENRKIEFDLCAERQKVSAAVCAQRRTWTFPKGTDPQTVLFAIVWMRNCGWKYNSIGDAVGISGARVSQLLSREERRRQSPPKFRARQWQLIDPGPASDRDTWHVWTPEMQAAEFAGHLSL